MTDPQIDAALLQAYVNITPAPRLDDAELHAWADLYQSERLSRHVCFDLFISDPVRACIKHGVVPRPYDAGSAPTENERRLLRIQRHIMGAI